MRLAHTYKDVHRRTQTRLAGPGKDQETLGLGLRGPPRAIWEKSVLVTMCSAGAPLSVWRRLVRDGDITAGRAASDAGEG